MMKKQKTLIHLMCVGFVSAIYASNAIAQNVDETRYYNPRNPVRVVSNEECLHADPLCFLQVSKLQTSSFQVSQICDTEKAKQAYAIPLEEQLRTGSVIGNEFCKGVLSVSNMELPFTKEQTGITNANDGMFLVDAARAALLQISDQLKEMTVIAGKSATGTMSSTQLISLDITFQAIKSKIEATTREANFNGYPLLNGVRVAIPTRTPDFFAVQLMNTHPNDIHLEYWLSVSIDDLHVSTNRQAQDALAHLSTALEYVDRGLRSLNYDYQRLKSVAEEEGVKTYVDMNTTNNTITRKGPRA